MSTQQQVYEFIEENIDLIEQNTKESWEQIYAKLPSNITGKFTETILDARINDPASIIGYISNYYLLKSNIREYVTPDNVTSIGNHALSHCSGLTSLEISDSVTSIGIAVFANCNKLTSVKIGNSVTRISTYAFSDCKSLTSIDIPDSVTSIGNYAFNGCSSLTSVVIPDSVTSIGYGAFFHCNNLTEIVFKGTKKQATTKSKARDENWRRGSSIKRIICSDGVIEL